MTNVYDGQAWAVALLFFGGILNMVFAFSIFFIKELQVHPFKIFMYTAMFESILMFELSAYVNICSLNTPQIFAYTVFFDSSCDKRLDSLHIIS